ncbi:hypothetical protein CUT44_32350 [Streptomyces carminius]|uniref:Uncharacterized protein n=1 Tax=Streptomyces carminius TaxID=2665496 RepID=A0A2M8LPJ1_9ACTN|nr:hypothetical protein CUT44_32350 [Streptomyces carminius]
MAGRGGGARPRRPGECRGGPGGGRRPPGAGLPGRGRHQVPGTAGVPGGPDADLRAARPPWTAVRAARTRRAGFRRRPGRRPGRRPETAAAQRAGVPGRPGPPGAGTPVTATGVAVVAAPGGPRPGAVSRAAGYGAGPRGVTHRFAVRYGAWDSMWTPRSGGCGASSCTGPAWS